jgi:hypothetical protein
MNIHEQIIAFLDGEMRDESQVAELLHVLAVAPEKQRMLIDQVQIRRSFTTFGGGLASPLAADAAILQGLHAIDAGFPSAGPSPSASAAPPPSAPLFRYSPMLMGSVAALLITVGGVIGYIFGSGGTTRSDDGVRAGVAATAPATPGGVGSHVTTEGARVSSSTGSVASTSGTQMPGTQARGIASGRSGDVGSSTISSGHAATVSVVNGSDGLVVALRDSLSRLRARYASLLAANARETRRIASSSNIAAVAPRNPVAPASHDVQSVIEHGPVGATTQPTIAAVRPRTIGGGVGTSEFGIAAMTPPAQMEKRPLTDAELAVPERVWQIGMRSNFRISFPRIYGIEPRPNALTDREITMTRRLDAGAMGLRMPMRMGIAVGGTQFSESFHTNTGGHQIDTIIEQTPSFFYGRGFIAPELISSENFGASLELGGGGTVVGPFATVGLGLEYRALDRVSVDIGLDSWLLWTKLEQQAIMSTNLNAHVGAAMWFSFDEIFK